MIKASSSTLRLSQVFRLRVARKDCSAVADKAGTASRFLPFKKKKKHSLGMHFCRNLPTSAADLKFSVKEAYLIYISNSQWYWSSLISIGNNKSCSRRRDGLKFNNVYILQIVIGASCLRLFWPILHLFSACSLNYISAEKLFREKNKELRDFGDSTEGLHFTLILFL